MARLRDASKMLIYLYFIDIGWERLRDWRGLFPICLDKKTYLN